MARGQVTRPAPSATADTAANSTSLTITTAVALAGRRAEPYCKARLLSRNTIASPSMPLTQPAAGAGGQGTVPATPSHTAASSDTPAPPANMARARALSGRWASRRSITLFRAKVKPPTSASASPVEVGTGQAEPSVGHSTMAAPLSASTTRTAASRVSRSPSSTRASSTAHSGMM